MRLRPSTGSTRAILATAALTLVATACTGSDSPESTGEAALGTGVGRASTMTGPRPVLVDTDMGVDDVVALTFLIEHPDIDVRAITISGTGLTRCAAGVPNALGLLGRLGAPHIPVTCGSETPTTGSNAFPEPWRRQADDFFGLSRAGSSGAPDRRPAADLLVDIVADTPEPLTVLTLGPLTNLAQALEQSPAITDGIEAVYTAGAAFDVAGNVDGTDEPEWNLFIDPDAAARVLASDLTVTLVTLDATLAEPLAPALSGRFEAPGSPGAEVIAGLLTSGRLDSTQPASWEPLVAAALVDESVAAYTMSRIRIGPDGSIEVAPDGPRIRVATAGDIDRFDEIFLSFYSPPPETIVNSPADGPEVVEGELVWEYELMGDPNQGDKSKAQVAGDVTYFVGFDNRLYSVDALDGETVWTRALEGAGPGSVELALSDDAIFYRDIDLQDDSPLSIIAAADRFTGEELWSVQTDLDTDGTVRTPTYSDGVVFYGVSNDGLVAADATSGETLWTFPAPMAQNAGAPAVVDGVAYFGALDGSLYALDAETGAELWRARSQPSSLGVTSTPAVVDGVVYFGGDSGEFMAVGALTGETIWQVQIARTPLPSSPLVVGDRVYFGTIGLAETDLAGVVALDIHSGEELWRFGQLGGFVLSSPAHHDGAILFLDVGGLYAVDAVTGQERWRFSVDGRPSGDSPVVDNGIVYFQAGGSFYAVAPPA